MIGFEKSLLYLGMPDATLPKPLLIYLMYLTGKEPIENVCKGEGKLGR